MTYESYAYPVRVVEDSGFQVYNFRDLPEAIGQADSKEELQADAIETLEMVLTDYMEEGLRIPPASQPKKGEIIIDLPLTLVGKVILHNAMIDGRYRPIDLARALDLPTSEIARITNPKRKTKIDTLASAVQVTGKKMRLIYV